MSSIVVTGRIPARRLPRPAVASPAAPLAAPATSPSTGSLRLTRRGRVVVRLAVAVVVLAAVAVAVLAIGGVAAAGKDAGPSPVTVHVVMPGETLWGIAGTVAPGADPRDVVAGIVRLNDLPSADVRAGQRLVLPAAQ